MKENIVFIMIVVPVPTNYPWAFNYVNLFNKPHLPTLNIIAITTRGRDVMSFCDHCKVGLLPGEGWEDHNCFKQEVNRLYLCYFCGYYTGSHANMDGHLSGSCGELRASLRIYSRRREQMRKNEWLPEYRDIDFMTVALRRERLLDLGWSENYIERNT